ncbi:MAG: hypothetical protein HOC70_00785 [Gammaproteobacteria bacterium]|jgi:tetratricopeptide (TPR) repeat protein|nr:hypothetical protein [Gammaproteobacteria bacterium]MBT4491749.1 hypothetical protein [Gammaproteobacteria bacterium]
MRKLATSKFLISLALVSIFSMNAFGCTMFKITKNGRTIVGNNEDWSNPHTRIWFEAGNEAEFGVAYVGFDDLNPQGAFNEAGLAYDIFAMPDKKIIEAKEKEAQPDDLLKTIMKTSSTVEEVKAKLEIYSLKGFSKVMLLFVDKSGRYLIQEYDEFTIGEQAQYVLSNFSPSKITDHSKVELPHFQKGRSLLGQKPNLDPGYCATVLDALHQEVPYWGGTQYSTLYNLHDGTINLYYFHDYSRSVQFDLEEELAKGNHVLNIPDMFPEIESGHEYMANYDEYAKNLFLLEKSSTFSDPKVLSKVVEKIQFGPPKKMIYAHYYRIETIGKEWLAKNDYRNAISVFSINADVFDWVASPFRHLAHAYMLDSQYEMAIENYSKVLEINPGDENAKAQLQEIATIKSKLSK